MEINNENKILYILGENVEYIYSINEDNKFNSYRKYAEFLEYDRKSLSRLMAGKQNIQIESLVNIAKKLNVSFPMLFSRNFKDVANVKNLKNNKKRLGVYEDKDYMDIFIKNVYLTMKNNLIVQMNVGQDSSTTNRILKKKIKNPRIKSLIQIATDINANIIDLFSENMKGEL